MRNFYYDYENHVDEDEEYEVNTGIINYGDGNSKKCAPSIDEYDGNESQEYQKEKS